MSPPPLRRRQNRVAPAEPVRTGGGGGWGVGAEEPMGSETGFSMVRVGADEGLYNILL